MTFLKAGFQTEDLSHIISFRRQTHIKFEDMPKNSGSILIHSLDVQYRIVLTDDTLFCYICDRSSHTSAHKKTKTEHNANTLIIKITT